MAAVFTISSGCGFLEVLARGLWQRAQKDPLCLAGMTVFLPTRRACLVLRDVFLNVTDGGAALLPRLRPLGDMDDEQDVALGAMRPDLNPAISPLRRQLLLARLIAQKDSQIPWERAIDLASALAGLLDQVQREEKEFASLASLVPAQYALHWQETLAFLEIITSAWPLVLAEEGCLDPLARRRQVLDSLTASWKALPPDKPVFIAGSTGSEPAIGRLMAVLAQTPQGAVILPGLDKEMEEEAWQAVDETHPQFTMKTWLERSEFSRQNVRPWDERPEPASHRTTLLREAMRPPGVTEGWRGLGLVPAAREGLEKLELENQREEADVIALYLRAALEQPGQTAALVTPDRALARRVAAALGRWSIAIDDSAGETLDVLPLGVFLKALLAAALPEASPIDALALLKHPLMLFGEERAAVLRRARRAEKKVWRGVRPPGGWASAARLAALEDESLATWLERLGAILVPLADPTPLTLAERLSRHIEAAEALAAGAQEEGAARLWRGAAGEKAAAWIEDVRAASTTFPPLGPQDYGRVLAALMADVTVRPTLGRHPRLHILGPLEARLLRFDVTVLGGLNEGTWPAASAPDPWLSRPMKKELELPLPEERAGLSAHDFVSLAGGARVLLTRARRSGGAGTVPSRFLLRLGAALAASGQEDLGVSSPWRFWAACLDVPRGVLPLERPAPRPPLEARPRKLSVTEIGTWQRNPYALYAKRILGLRKLEAIDADISAADKGEAIHKALEAFLLKTQKTWPQDPLALLLEEGRRAFEPYKTWPQIEAFWWPRFARFAQRFVEEEAARRAAGTVPLLIEARGEIKTAHGFTLSGRADRIDCLADGRVEVVDYKTGEVPKKAFVLEGVDPQLPLLAMMARDGGFGGKELVPSGLAYWSVKGARKEDKKALFTEQDVVFLMAKARAGLDALVEAFSHPETAYEATPKPRYRLRYDDYAHLARYAEWSNEDE